MITPTSWNELSLEIHLLRVPSSEFYQALETALFCLSGAPPSRDLEVALLPLID